MKFNHPTTKEALDLLEGGSLDAAQDAIIRDYLDSIEFHAGQGNQRRVQDEIVRLNRLITQLS